MNLYKKYTAKAYSVFVIHTILKADNPLCFRNNILGVISKLIMTIDDKNRNEKLQYDINREVAKILSLSSGKVDKYEYLTSEEILPPGQRQLIQQAKSTYSPLGKAFEKQIGKQVDALKSLEFPNKIELKQIESIIV